MLDTQNLTGVEKLALREMLLADPSRLKEFAPERFSETICTRLQRLYMGMGLNHIGQILAFEHKDLAGIFENRGLYGSEARKFFPAFFAPYGLEMGVLKDQIDPVDYKAIYKEIDERALLGIRKYEFIGESTKDIGPEFVEMIDSALPVEVVSFSMQMDLSESPFKEYGLSAKFVEEVLEDKAVVFAVQSLIAGFADAAAEKRAGTPASEQDYDNEFKPAGA